AADQLARSFTVRDGKVSARLAGRVESSAGDFNELLAPERRASLAQFAGASTPDEARQLKALLVLRTLTDGEGGDARAAAEAAREFGAGQDEMRAFRNLYAASRLELRGSAPAEALARAEAAIGGVDAALKLAHAPVALFADTDEMREMRRQVVEQDAPLNMLGVDRDTLSRVLRGRIESLAGWALYSQGQTAEAAVRLRRAVSVLPERSLWWRTAEWRLGAALEASGSARDALAAYVASYRVQPDPKFLPAIEALYKKLNNGSTGGLEQLLGTPAVASAAPAAAQAPAPDPATQAATPAASNATTAPAPEPSPEPATTPTPAATPAPTPAAEPTPSATPAPPAATPSPSPEAATTPTPEPSKEEPSATPTPEAAPTPAATPAAPTTPPEPEPSPAPARARERAGAAPGGPCVLTAAEPALTLKSNGGSATVALSVENYAGKTPPRINPSTDNWADIIILAEPHKPEDGNGARFTVTSVSAKTGAFLVTFASPCGKRQVTVNVQ
ncbi:MAG TPA: hypothetical protein VF654_10065, partial [Pyrinomonadaceae bacterium]